MEAIVRGRVQGVGFRVFVLRRARSLGLVGWVANDPSGRVRWVGEGSPDALRELLDATRDGPPAAWVDAVDETWGAPTGEFADFEISSGWHSGD